MTTHPVIILTCSLKADGSIERQSPRTAESDGEIDIVELAAPTWRSLFNSNHHHCGIVNLGNGEICLGLCNAIHHLLWKVGDKPVIGIEGEDLDPIQSLQWSYSKWNIKTVVCVVLSVKVIIKDPLADNVVGLL